MKRKGNLIAALSSTKEYSCFVQELQEAQNNEQLLKVAKRIITEAQAKASEFGLHVRGENIVVLSQTTALFPELQEKKNDRGKMQIETVSKISPPFRPIELMKQIGM
ncbi:MAG: hypothetical protein ACM3UU_07585 [Ignavibacteriales bacterium]